MSICGIFLHHDRAPRKKLTPSIGGLPVAGGYQAVMAQRSAGVLFDVDGTLVDTSYLHTVTWWEVLLEHGYDVPMARIHRAIGMGSDKLIEHLLGEGHDRADDAPLRDGHLDRYTRYWDRLRPLPGARDLLRTVAGRGLKVVLASSASAKELDALRRALDADDAVDAATSASDAEASKPEPDILAVAMRRGGLSAGAVALVGDSVWDVAAAGRAGIPCIGLSCGGTGAAELRRAGAVETYDDPAALCAALDRSLLGRLAAGHPR
jgi:HAD superfamily hydrolase (TIGR01509 family)